MGGDYRIEARIKNGRLWAALRRACPGAQTQAEIARQCGVKAETLSGLLTMRLWPGLRGHRGNGEPARPWSKVAYLLAEITGETPEFLFDPALYGRRAHKVVFEMDQAQLAQHGLLELPPAPDEVLERTIELPALIKESLAALPPAEQSVLRALYGLEGQTIETAVEYAARVGRTESRIYQLRDQGLAKLRRSRTRIPSMNAIRHAYR